MEFVLDDQPRREAIPGAEEHPCFLHPYQSGELVDRRYEKGRRLPVEVLIDGVDGKFLGEDARRIRTVETE